MPAFHAMMFRDPEKTGSSRGPLSPQMRLQTCTLVDRQIDSLFNYLGRFLLLDASADSSHGLDSWGVRSAKYMYRAWGHGLLMESMMATVRSCHAACACFACPGTGTVSTV